MNSMRDDRLLSRVLELQLPDVFTHPIWVNFVETNDSISPDLIQELLKASVELQAEGELIDACQVLLICAALQKRLNDPIAAMGSIQRVWALSDRHNLPKVSKWAAWGASAVSISHGDYQQAAEHLHWLQTTLRGDDWVLANVVEVIRKNLSGLRRESTLPRIIVEYFIRWGESSQSFQTAPRNGNPSFHGNLPSTFSFQRFRLFWDGIKKTIRCKLPPKRVEKKEYSVSAGLPGVCLPSLCQAVALPQIHRSSLPSSVLQLDIPTSSGNANGSSFAPPPPLPQSLPSPTPSDQSANNFSLFVYCLGALRVYQNESLIENWPSKKGQSIFKFLVTHRRSSITKDILMDTFWPEADPEAARRNLHQAIYALRKTLKLSQLDFQYIQFENDSYRLNPDINIWVDCEEFERHVQSGRRLEQLDSLDAAMIEYSIAEGLYQDDFLTEDLYEEWAQSHRQYLWQSYLMATHRLANYYLERGEYAAAIALSQRVLNLDNSQEEAHQNLIRCFLKLGQRHLALSQYQLCVQTLNTKFDLPPSAETQKLYQKIVSE